MTEIRLKHRLRRALVPGHGEKWDLHLLDISGAVSEKLGGSTTIPKQVQSVPVRIITTGEFKAQE
jgi:hypothetical protein